MSAKPLSPEEIEHVAGRLQELSRNIWWSWNPPAQDLFKELASRTWQRSGHNAVAVMQALGEGELRAVLSTSHVGPWAKKVVQSFDDYMSDWNTWASFHAPEFTKETPVAYFSAEFGLHESLPIYSGGLGILSGDHMKSTSDLGLPCIGIGLFYKHGYFTQRIDPQGWQTETYPNLNPDALPVEPALGPDGAPIVVRVRIGHANVAVRAFRVNIGRIRLYLLDTDLPDNEQHWREITSRVYGGDQMTRIGQELILGVGGLRFLEALGVRPRVHHLNEGHSSFLILELLRREIEAGATLTEAGERIRSGVVFTTHTPVAAGHDRFSADLMGHLLVGWPEKLRVSFEEFMGLGRVEPTDASEPFCMTVLSLRHCRAANAVSELNGRVSREMWADLFGRPEMKGRPAIGHITNGVHILGWMNRVTYDFWSDKLGEQWIRHLKQDDFWEKVSDESLVSDAEIWGLRYRLKRQLIESVRERIANLHMRATGETSGPDDALDPDALTIGFSRRFATYKRAPLLFSDIDRAARLFNDPARPIQIVFAGKAHPRDDAGKGFIQRIVQLSRDPRFMGKVFFVEGYEIELARLLLSGIDVMLNNPRRPLEASGTSGQKISVHGGINFSVLDGWWREGYDGHNGFAIGKDEESKVSPEEQDALDAEEMYRTLETKILPEFYDRDERGLPRKWIRRIRRAMATLIPKYTTDRMVSEYTEKYYKTRE